MTDDAAFLGAIGLYLAVAVPLAWPRDSAISKLTDEILKDTARIREETAAMEQQLRELRAKNEQARKQLEAGE